MSYRNHYMCLGEATSRYYRDYTLQSMNHHHSKSVNYILYFVITISAQTNNLLPNALCSTSGFATTHVVVSVRHPIIY